MSKDWLKNLGSAADDVKNKLDEVYDNAPDDEAFADDKEKLREFIGHEDSLAVQRAERILNGMIESGKGPPGWANEALTFLMKHVPEEYFILKDPRS